MFIAINNSNPKVIYISLVHKYISTFHDGRKYLHGYTRLQVYYSVDNM